MDANKFVDLYPRLYHMAQGGAWPSIQRHGLLSTSAIVDLYNVDSSLRVAIATNVRRESVSLTDPDLGTMTIRDQRPMKFLDECLEPGASRLAFLSAINTRIFFFPGNSGLYRLMGAKLYRDLPQTVIEFDTRAVVEAFGHVAELAPYNTGSMHVPTAPIRSAAVFKPISEYPYDFWEKKRRHSSTEPVSEFTLPYSMPQAEEFVLKAQTWVGGASTETLYER